MKGWQSRISGRNKQQFKKEGSLQIGGSASAAISAVQVCMEITELKPEADIAKDLATEETKKAKAAAKKEALTAKKNRVVLKSFAQLVTLLSRCRSLTIIRCVDASYTTTLSKIEKECQALGTKDSDSLELEQKSKAIAESMAKLHHSLPETAPHLKAGLEPLRKPSDAEMMQRRLRWWDDGG